MCQTCSWHHFYTNLKFLAKVDGDLTSTASYVEYIMMESTIYSLDHLLHYSEVDLW